MTQISEERNYHIFYELLEGLPKEQKDKYGLMSADKYFYLNQGKLELYKAELTQEDILFCTQFPSLGIFINKKVGFQKISFVS